MQITEAEETYFDDINEKKKTGRGVTKFKSNFKHRLRSAVDLMTPYERAKYRKAGDITVSNLYDTIIPREEFDLLEPKEQKAMMIHWRETYPNKQIQQELGYTSNASFHNLIKKLDVPRRRRAASTSKAVSISQTKQKPIVNKEVPDIIKQQPIQLITNGMHLEYNGKYNAEQLDKIFTKLQMIVEGEEKQYQLSISLSEK